MNEQSLPPPDATLWSRLIHTPLSDALRGRLTGRLDLRAAIQAAALPQPLADLTRTVARRTRLWRIEQVDVARELADHFRDGLAAGRTPEELMAAFGDPQQAARLIRRARRRCRPLIWRLWRMTWQMLAVAFLLVSAVSLFWLARFFLVHPTISHNYGIDLVGSTQQVAEADRAWPLYREAILNFTDLPQVASEGPNAPPAEEAEGENAAGKPEDGGAQPAPATTTRLDLQATKPGDKNWEKVLEWLDQNRAALAAAREGATKPRFGFLLDDPADGAWLKSAINDPQDIDPRLAPQGLGMVLLPQVQDLYKICWLLIADGQRSVDEGNAEAFLADVRSLLGLARQMRGDWPLWVYDHVSFYDFQRALDVVDQMLAERPELVDEREIGELAHALVGYAGDGSIDVNPAGGRLMALDLVQRIYSDNGWGNGSLTRDGLQLLRDTGVLYALENRPTARLEPWLDNTPAGAAVTATAPSRRQMTRLLTEYFDRGEREFRRPLWKWTDIDYLRELRKFDRSQYDLAAFAPLVMLRWMPRTYYYSEIVAQRRDATLVALALVLFHRRHAAWPQRLEELVPDLLPAVPPDRFTGEPIAYRLVDGHPLLYSVGPDKTDDAGRSLAKPDEIFKVEALWPADEKARVPSGDWILWPPQPDNSRPRS